jgi:hypothetical protein
MAQWVNESKSHCLDQTPKAFIAADIDCHCASKPWQEAALDHAIALGDFFREFEDRQRSKLLDTQMPKIGDYPPHYKTVGARTIIRFTI